MVWHRMANRGKEEAILEYFSQACMASEANSPLFDELFPLNLNYLILYISRTQLTRAGDNGTLVESIIYELLLCQTSLFHGR